MSSKVTYRQQYTRCGKQRCRKCKEGAGHGPYWYAYWSSHGRTVSKYIGTHLPAEVDAAQQLLETSNSAGAINVTLANSVRSSNEEIPHHPSTGAVPADTTPTMRVHLLGQFHIERKDADQWITIAHQTWHRRRARALLGCLLSSPGRMLGREQAMEALWPELDTDTAANRLNGAVHELRRILEPELERPAASTLLHLEHDVLKLANSSHIWVDADVFDTLLNKANTASDPGQVEKILEEAAALYGGDYLLEELYSEWSAPRREALRRGWMGLLLKLAELRAARGALTSALEPLDRLLAVDPTHETAVRGLMVLLTQLDRRGEALLAYQQLATLLQRLHANEPLPETRELYEALRQGHLQFPPPGGTIPLAPGQQEQGESEPRGTPKEQPHSGPIHNTRDARMQIFSHLAASSGSARQFIRQKQSPLIGRERELDVMRRFMLAAEARSEYPQGAPLQIIDDDNLPGFSIESSAHLLLLMGEPGIGKTRLAEELSQEATLRHWSVSWSRSYEQESTIPYRPWREVLRTLFQNALNDFYDSHADPFPFIDSIDRQRLSTLLPELAELDPDTLPQQRSASPLAPEQERLYLWEATLGLLRILSKTSPLLIVLDDLHWTDDSSLELLTYLLRHLRDERILFAGTCRDMELPPTSSLRSLISDLRRDQAILTLPVKPLTNYQIASLVAHLPQRIVQSISTQAAGNPFFAEELARVSEISPQNSSGDEMRHISPAEEDPKINNRVGTLPETIAAVLDRRLGRLSSNCQALLGKAAVLGGSFELSQLLFMAGDQDQNIEDVLLALLEEALYAGILVEEGTGTRIIYHFWHPLIVSHLYDRLSAARRAQLHRRAANALLQAYSGQENGREGKLQHSQAAAITHHLDKGGGNPQQKAQFAEIAGNSAYALCAYSEAQYYYRQAVDALSDKSSRSAVYRDRLHLARLLERVAECNMVEGNFKEVRDLYMRALDLRNSQWTSASEKNRGDLTGYTLQQEEAQISALIWREIGRAAAATGEYPYALQCYKRGKQVMHEAGVTSGAAWACLHLQEGKLHWVGGNYDEARQYAQEALEILERAMQEQSRRGPIYRAQEWGKQAPLDSAPTSELQTRTVRSMIGDPLEVGDAHEFLGVIAVSAGRFSEALKHLNTALAIFEQHDLLMMMAQVCGNLGAVHAMKAENTVARAYYHRSLELAERMGDLPNMAFTTGNLGDVAARSGDLLEAEAWFKRSLALAERVNDREHKSWCNVALAAALQDQGNMRGALECIRHALALGRAINSTRYTGFALIALGDWRIAQAIAVSQGQPHEPGQPHELSLPYADPRLRSPDCNRLLLRARAALQRALDLEGLDAEVMTEGQLVLASVYFLQGDVETAYSMASRTMEEARQREITRVLARSQRLLGRIFAVRGQHVEADAYFEQALQEFRIYEMRLDYARTLHGYGDTLLQRSGPGDSLYLRGLAYLHEARTIFAECKASIDLKWIEELLGDFEFQNVKVS